MPKSRIRSGDDAKLENLWYSIGMTKLQSIISQIQELPAEEREELNLMLQLNTSKSGDIFELTDAQLEELDRRLAVVDNEPTFTIDEVFAKFIS